MRQRKPRNQKIRARTAHGKIEVGGWLAGKQSYLRMQASGPAVDWISAPALYRLAKAIVRRYEAQP